MFNSECTNGYNSKDLVYFLEVSCSADYIYVFNSDTFYFEKKNVGIIVVSCDIAITLILAGALYYSKFMQDLICQEIDDKEVTASDFTVEIRGIGEILPSELEGMSINTFKAILWRWVEEQTEKYQDPSDDAEPEDLGENRLMQINFGFSDYGRIKILLELDELFKHEATI